MFVSCVAAVPDSEWIPLFLIVNGYIWIYIYRGVHCIRVDVFVSCVYAVPDSECISLFLILNG